MFIATLFTIARTWKQPICPSTDECKEVVVAIRNGILLSHKKSKFESVVVRWMKLKPVTQTETSQEEKNKYSILIHTHIYMESRKMILMKLFAGKEWRLRCRE